MTVKQENLKKKLEQLQQEYSGTKYNKATNKHLGILRKKIATVKEDIVEAGKKQQGEGFMVKKAGDARVALIGFPNSGKSTLINALTNAGSKAGNYAFTTLDTIPGMLIYNDAHIQILDLPGIIQKAHAGLGGGKQVLGAARTANAILIVADINRPEHIQYVIDELNNFNIYINKRAPEISIVEQKTGGISIEVNKSGISKNQIEDIFRTLRIYNVKVRIMEAVDKREFEAFVKRKATYINSLIALNKIDTVSNYKSVCSEIEMHYHLKVVPISAEHSINIEQLKHAIYSALDVIRIYLAPRGRHQEPIVVKAGARVGDVAKTIRMHMPAGSYAYISGPSADFPNQKVGASHVLEENDRITFVNKYVETVRKQI